MKFLTNFTDFRIKRINFISGYIISRNFSETDIKLDIL